MEYIIFIWKMRESINSLYFANTLEILRATTYQFCYTKRRILFWSQGSCEPKYIR